MIKNLATLLIIALSLIPHLTFADQLAPQEIYAHRALSAVTQIWHPSSAVVLVIDARTQRYIAGAHHNSDSSETPIPTGSTLKTLTMAAAIEEGLPTDTLAPHLDGDTTIGKRTLKDYQTNPDMDPADVIARSSNIGMIPAARHLGDARLRRWLDTLGLIELNAPLSDGDLVAMAAGIDSHASPLALARAYATLVTGEQYGKQVFSPETTTWARAALEHAVTAPYATAHKLLTPGLRIGAKTGTALVPPSGALPAGIRANIIAVYPIDDPKWIFVISVERPQNGKSSGQVTIPAMRQLITSFVDPTRH